MNSVNIVGNVTRDPEARTTQGGMEIASFGVAINRKTADGEKTVFVDVSVFSKLAGVVSQYVNKGDKVAVTGRLELDTWESDGVRKSKLYVIGNEVDFLSKAGEGKGSQEQGSAPSRGKPAGRPSNNKPAGRAPSKAPAKDWNDDEDVPF